MVDLSSGKAPLRQKNLLLSTHVQDSALFISRERSILWCVLGLSMHCNKGATSGFQWMTDRLFRVCST